MSCSQGRRAIGEEPARDLNEHYERHIAISDNYRGDGQEPYPRLTDGGECIEETLSCYRLPLAYHKQLKSINMLQGLNRRSSGGPRRADLP